MWILLFALLSVSSWLYLWFCFCIEAIDIQQRLRDMKSWEGWIYGKRSDS